VTLSEKELGDKALHTFAALIEDFNHTCIYLAKASSEVEARAKIWAALSGDEEMPLGRPEQCFCFDVRLVNILDTDHVQPIFCSSDHIFDIEPNELDQYILNRYDQLAQTCMFHGRYTEAVDIYSSVLKLDKLEGYYGLAEAYIGLQQYHDSIAAYEKVIQILDAKVAEGSTEFLDCGSRYGALQGLGSAYEALGDVANAKKYYREWIRLQRFDEFPLDSDADKRKVAYVRDAK
jgi:tetratricopeptide (TPR) repeat protein